MATLTSCIFKKKVFSEEKISVIDPLAVGRFFNGREIRLSKFKM